MKPMPRTKTTTARVSEPSAHAADYMAALVSRITANHGGDAYFSEHELRKWPPEFLRAIQGLKLLRPASPAQRVSCPGCERACNMPVDVEKHERLNTFRAVIDCDRRDDIGRVDVPVHLLERRKTSGGWLAEAVAALAGLSNARAQQLEAGQWRLGILQGNKQKGPLALMFDRQAVLSIAGHAIPLAEVLSFDGQAVVLDSEALRKLVDNPIGAHAVPNETMEERAERYRREQNKFRAQGVRDWQRKAAESVGTSLSRFKQVLAEYPEDSGAPDLMEAWNPKPAKSRRVASKKAITRKDGA